MANPVILASASPQRKELLERMGFVVRDMPANLGEERLDGEPPEVYVKRVAREKVLTVVNRIRQNLYPTDDTGARTVPPIHAEGLRWVVGADTIVVLGDKILGKPTDSDHALEMLTMLSGTTHKVITGFCVFDIAKDKEGIQAVTSTVKFKRANAKELEAYVATGESVDKAGSYAVQGVGAYLAETIDGSFTNVVGLPLCQVVEMMQEMGATDVLPF